MKLLRRSALALAATGLLASAVFSPIVHAQAYPSKQITIVVSYPAGGDTDALARLYAEKLAKSLNQTVIVENRPGASGTIGNSFVSKSAPDGHTLLFTPNTFSIAPWVLKAGTGAQYDPINDFTPIIQVGTQSLFLVVNTASGVASMKDLVAAAKSGKVATYGSPGSGSPMHILGELFNKSAGVQIKQVPYRGTAPAVVDLLGGHIPFVYTTLGPVAQHIASGKLAVLAVADAKRSPLAPNVPTLTESGFRDSDVGAWQGLMGPKGLPAEVAATLNRHMNEILKMPDVIERMHKTYTEVTGGDSAVLARANALDFNRYGKVVKEFGIQAD